VSVIVDPVVDRIIDPIVFYSGNKRVVVDRRSKAIKSRLADGTAQFNGHEKVYKNEHGYFVVTKGRCTWCAIAQPGSKITAATGDCRSRRVSILRSLIAPRSPGHSWNVMRVKGNTKGKKKNFDEAHIREIELPEYRIMREMRELNPDRPFLEAFCEAFNHVDVIIRNFELEEKAVAITGGMDAVRVLRNERKEVFVNWISLAKEQGSYSRMAEFVIKMRTFIFPAGDPDASRLAVFGSFFIELEAIAREQRSKANESHRRAARLRLSTH
jgi:hypothetical protein